MINFEVLDEMINGFSVIKILEGKFKDVEFCYGSVGVEPNGDEATLSYEYNLIEGSIDENSQEFKQLTGDILLSLLEEQLENEKVVYSGGSDEA